MTEAAARPDAYYAVIFASAPGADREGYAATAMRMVQLAQQQPGFLGVEHAGPPDGASITVSYWKDLESIAAWRADAEHTQAREQGRARWYSRFSLRVARVEREHHWRADRP